MQNRGKILQTSLLGLIKASVEWVKIHYIYIYIFIYILGNVIINMFNFLQHRIISSLILGFIFLIVVIINREYEKEKLKFKNNIPVLKQRFTKIEDKKIYIEKEQINEMLLYLYSVENYLEKIGFYN